MVYILCYFTMLCINFEHQAYQAYSQTHEMGVTGFIHHDPRFNFDQERVHKILSEDQATQTLPFLDIKTPNKIKRLLYNHLWSCRL